MIKTVCDDNLCISCRICAAVCPAGCINFQKENGMFFPYVHEKSCTHCGKCFRVCPGKCVNYGEKVFDERFGLPDVLGVFTARTKDKKILRNATSGGIATEIISSVLKSGEYKNSFVVCGHEYNEQPTTKIIDCLSDLKSSQKSRYVIISHEDCAKYIINHRDEKLILIGTSCFIHGVINLMKEFDLNRENYLLLGLFCDKTMNMNVIDYFKRRKSFKELYFRTKDAGGWPGNVRLVDFDGNIIDLPNTERMKVKNFFQPERCLYCLDKLNIFADISMGDNYTGRNSDKDGSSSVIIRTQKGLKVWEECAKNFEVHLSSVEDIITSQHTKEREKNYFFARLKEKSTGRKINVVKFNGKEKNLRSEYRRRLHLIKLGENYPAMLIYMRLQSIKRFVMKVLRKKFFPL